MVNKFTPKDLKIILSSMKVNRNKGVFKMNKKVIMSILEDKKGPQKVPQTSKSVEKIDFTTW